MKSIPILSLSILWIISTSDVYGRTMEVEGTITIGNDNASPSEEAIRWSGLDFQGWNGNKWVSLTGSAFRTVKDIDDNVYRTVVIWDEEWMAQNLRGTRYNEGSTIFPATSKLIWDSANSLGFGAYCSYNFDADNGPQYGFLYNGATLMSGFNVCPVGGHVPSNDEFTILGDYVATEMTSRGGN